MLDDVLGPPVQIAYAVPDAVAAAEQWTRTTGAGPFFVAAHIPLVDVVVRGRPAEFDHTSAYGQWGPVMLELVQCHSAAPNVVVDVLGDRPSGLHHLACWVDDLDEATAHLAERGHPLAMSARTTGGTEFRFIDTIRQFGHLVELYVATPQLRGFYAMVAAAAADWDGTDPVRAL